MAVQVIGAGFGRTGTASLKLALEQLGLGPCYHMSEVFVNPDHVPLWVETAKGNPDFQTILAGYQSCVDFPACTHYQALMGTYPDAKVVLSTRDPNRWFDSVNETIMSPRTVEFLRHTPMSEMMQRNIYDLFDGRIDDREHMVECFLRHEQQVRQTVPADRLLVFEAAMGWQPLCDFLAVPIPETAYPHVNTKEDFAKLFTDATASDRVADQIKDASSAVFKPKN